MWWVKCIGSCLILGGCGYLGWQQGAKLRRRIGLLREMIQGFIIFKSLTGTYRFPLNIVFSRISEQTRKPVSDFYKRLNDNFSHREGPDGEILWKKTVEEMSYIFESEDRGLIEGLGNFIGIQDLKVQAGAVDDCIQEIRERIHQLEAERPEKEKLYHILSLTIGGFIVILLF